MCYLTFLVYIANNINVFVDRFSNKVKIVIGSITVSPYSFDQILRKGKSEKFGFDVVNVSHVNMHKPNWLFWLFWTLNRYQYVTFAL